MQVPRSPASTTFSAFEYILKAASTYLLYFYIRSDLGAIISLGGEPVRQTEAVIPSAYNYAASDKGAGGAEAPYSGGYPTGQEGSGGYNSVAIPSSPGGGGGYQGFGGTRL